MQRPQPNWNEYAGLGALRAVIDPLDRDGVKNAFIDRLQWGAVRPQLGPPGRLLDLGCGTGRMAERVLARGFDYTGIDASEKMIEVARASHADPRARFEVAPCHATPFADGAFDVCLTVGVHQYLINGPEGPSTMKEIARVLRPGGRLVMIEQASLSGGRSGTVASAATPDDYRRELSPHFEIELLRRARSSASSRVSQRALRLAVRAGPLRSALVKLTAEYERLRLRTRGERYFRALPYFDILVVAVPRRR